MAIRAGLPAVVPARRAVRVDRSVSLCEGGECSAEQFTSIQSSILQVLRARGGRLWLGDLVFELRWRGARPEVVRRELKDLVQRGLVRGPLAHQTYELTAGGWDLSRQE